MKAWEFQNQHGIQLGAVHQLRLQKEGGRWSKKLTFCKLLYTRVGNVYPGWPVYGVKCICSRGRESEREGATSTSISIFDSYGMKTF